jgi:hypothetical protein
MARVWNLESERKLSDLAAENIPLVVDLDGTLLRTDLTAESALRLLKQKPWLALLMPLWLLKGRAYLKRRIFELVEIDLSLLPLHEQLLAWLRDEEGARQASRSRHCLRLRSSVLRSKTT